MHWIAWAMIIVSELNASRNTSGSGSSANSASTPTTPLSTSKGAPTKTLMLSRRAHARSWGLDLRKSVVADQFRYGQVLAAMVVGCFLFVLQTRVLKGQPS